MKKIKSAQPPAPPYWQKLFDLDEIESILQDRAKQQKSISYAETLNRLGYHFSRPKMRALCVALHEIDARARRQKQPELAVLVVRATDGLPGAGWWSGRSEKDLDKYDGIHTGAEACDYIRKIQQKTFKYWKKHT
jgi:hypothetical protein